MPRLRSQSSRAVHSPMPVLRSRVKLQHEVSVVLSCIDSNLPKKTQQVTSLQNDSSSQNKRSSMRTCTSRTILSRPIVNQPDLHKATLHTELAPPRGRKTTDRAVSKRRTKPTKPIDPYEFDLVEDDKYSHHDDKENVDPTLKKTRVKRQHKPLPPPRSLAKPPQKSLSTSLSSPHQRTARLRPEQQQKLREHAAAATIRLPPLPSSALVRSSIEPAVGVVQLSATPVLCRAPISSTPADTLRTAMQATNPRPLPKFTPNVGPSRFVSPVGKPPSTVMEAAKTFEVEELPVSVVLPRVSYEPFVDDEAPVQPEPELPDEATQQDKVDEDRPSREHTASHSHNSHGSRRLSESDQGENYTSWLEEFNAQLEMFTSHELTIEKTPREKEA